MQVISNVIPFLWLYLIALIIILPFKGILYDDAKKKEDPKYKGNHSFSYSNGQVSFPFPIFVNTKNKTSNTNKYARKFNLIVFNIWLTALLLLILYTA